MNLQQTTADELIKLIESRESWFIDQIIFYCKNLQITKYALIPRKTWEPTVTGITNQISTNLHITLSTPLLHPGENHLQDPLALFSHHETGRLFMSGVECHVFFGILKYLRQCYTSAVAETMSDQEGKSDAILYLDSIFDRMELGIVIFKNQAPAGISKKTTCRLDGFQENSKFLRQLINTIPVAVFYKDSQSRYIDCNDVFLEFLGLTRESVVGKTALDVLPKEQAEFFIEADQRLIKNGGSQTFEGFLPHSSGTIHEVLFMRAAYATGNARGVVGSFIDISARKNSERLLTQRLNLEQGLTKAGAELLNGEKDGDPAERALNHLLDASEASRVYIFENYLDPHKGLSARLIHEACATGIIPHIGNPKLQSLHYTPKLSRLESLLEQGVIIEGSRSDLHWQEQEFFADRDIQYLLIIPIIIEKKWLGFVGFDQCDGKRFWSKDDTSLLRTAAELLGAYLTQKKTQESLQLLESAIANTEEGIIITRHDIDTNNQEIVFLNKGFSLMTGYTEEEMLGKSPRTLEGEKSDSKEIERMEQTVTQGNVYHGEIINYRKDGAEIMVDWHVYPIQNDGGKITHYISVRRDITAQKSVKARIDLANKLESIGQLAAGIAHEINTPAQFILDNLTFAKTTWKDFKDTFIVEGQGDNRTISINPKTSVQKITYLLGEIPKALEDSVEGLQRITTIVKAMKEFSHPHDVKSNADINHALETTITIARNEWKYYAEVETEFDPELPLVYCSIGDLNQVFLNLLVNAAQAIGDTVGHSGKKGLIKIRTKRKTTHSIVIEIEDNGPGIPQEYHHRVYDPFFTTKPIGKGTGQGLYIAHQVIEKHNGSLTFESELGKGTTFYLELPIQEKI